MVKLCHVILMLLIKDRLPHMDLEYTGIKVTRALREGHAKGLIVDEVGGEGRIYIRPGKD